MSPAARRSRAERARRRAARECRDCAGALRADDGCRCAPCAEYHRGVEAERMRVKRAAARGAPARPRAERLSPEELARVASLRTRLQADLDALRAEVWPSGSVQDQIRDRNAAEIEEVLGVSDGDLLVLARGCA